MDWLSFSAQLIDSLVWPAVVITVIMLLRKPLTELIPLLRELSYKDLHLKFGQKLVELEARADMAAHAPSSGISVAAFDRAAIPQHKGGCCAFS